MNLKRIEKAQDAFNERYGVNFNIEAFEEKVSTLDNFTGGSDINEMYRTTFSDLQKKAFTNFVDAKIGKNFDCVQMLKDFDNEIMKPYGDERKAENKSAPMAMGGWMASEYLNSVYKSLDNVPNSKIEFATKRYRDGVLKMRDMQNLADKLSKESNPSSNELATLYCYSEALLNVNKERNKLSTVTNLGKHFAEIRESKNFKNIIAKATEGKTVNNDGTKKINEVLGYVNDDMIFQSRKSIKQAGDNAALAEDVKATNAKLKQKFSVKDLDNSSNLKTTEKIQGKEIASPTLNMKNN